MNKNTETTKRRYHKPVITTCYMAAESGLLAGSPNVQPGGGGGGSIEIVLLVPDVGTDDDILEG